jgi:hypothetical protein
VVDVRDTPLAPRGYQKVTGLSAVKTLTMPPTPAGPGQGTRIRAVLLKTETQAVRWRDDDVDPSATDGMLIDVGDEFWYAGKISKLRFIEVTPSATLHASLYA